MDIIGNLPEIQHCMPLSRPPGSESLSDEPPGHLHAHYSLGTSTLRYRPLLSISIHQGPSRGKERWKLCVTFLCSLSDLEFDKTWKQTILNDCHLQLSSPVSLGLVLKSTPSLSFRWSLQRDRIRDTYRWKMVSGVLSCTIHGKLLIHMVSYFGVTVFMQSLWPTVPQIGWVRTSCHT